MNSYHAVHRWRPLAFAACLGLTLLGSPTQIQAQSATATPGSEANTNAEWLPPEVFFKPTLAAPDEPRFSISFISSDILNRPAGGPGRPHLGLVGGQEFQAIAAMGGTLRLWRAATWEGGGLITGLQTGVFGRFLMAESANALMGTDWIVALPVEVRRHRFSGRVRFFHRSAHLGDEIIESTGVAREDYTFEALDFTSAFDVNPAVRVYGGATWVLRSQLADAPGVAPDFSDRAEFQAGFDASHFPWANGNSGLRLGVDLQWDDRVEWRQQLSVNGSFEARRGERAVRIGLIFMDGPSTVGQFYLNEEQFWGFEIRIDF